MTILNDLLHKAEVTLWSEGVDFAISFLRKEAIKLNSNSASPLTDSQLEEWIASTVKLMSQVVRKVA